MLDMGAANSDKAHPAPASVSASSPTPLVNPGAAIRAARLEADLTVEQLAGLVAQVRARRKMDESQPESDRRQIIGFESGHHNPGPRWRSLIAEALRIPQEQLFGPSVSRTLPPPLLAEVRVTDTTIANLLMRRAIYAQTEHIFGPTQVHAQVAQDMQVIDDLIRATPDELRRDMRLAAASIAELAGWLAQDSGDTRQADVFTAQALDHIHLVEDADPALVAMLFMRRSNILASSDPRTAVEFAERAARIASHLPTSRLHASIARQQAISALANSDAEGFLEHAAYAADLAEDQATTDPALGDLAAYATPGYVASETAGGLIHLDRADEAAANLQKHLAAWPDGQQRDYAVAALRLVRALAVSGDYPSAVHISDDALSAWRATPSARARRELQLIAKLLHNRSRHDKSLPLTELRRRIKDASEGH